LIFSLLICSVCLPRTNYLPMDNALPEHYFLVNGNELVKLILHLTEPLRKRIEYLESCLTEWVDTKEAMRITGIKSPDTLKTERERLGTLIKAKLEGRKPLYSRASLLAYNEARSVRGYKPKVELGAPKLTTPVTCPFCGHRMSG
jgi:hypothetical protein